MQVPGNSIALVCKMYRLFFICFLPVFFCARVPAVSRQLSDQERMTLFNSDVAEKLGITFPIFRAVECTDVSGKFYCLMSEHVYKENKENPLIDTIRAYFVTKGGDGYTIVWRFQDYIGEQKEYSIWFWTKFCTFEDLDKDGYTDPVLVYGTSGDNGFDDGRVNILVYNKNKKYAVRHQNGVLDFERNTRVDSAFYLLPASIMQRVISTMNSDFRHALKN